MQNPLVAYLRTYGPLAASDSIYDEHVLRAARENGVRPIEVSSPLLGRIIDNFRSADPVSVILTGTAGDGKTWHARKTYTALGGDPGEWDSAEGMLDFRLPSGKELLVVKDLSQFHEDSRQRDIFDGLKRSLTGEDASKVYLVCANDGQLLRFWRAHARDQQDERIDAALRVMLDADAESHEEIRLVMYNLSRLQHDVTFDNLVAEVTGHPDWERCAGCEARDKCPIRRNLALLAQDGDSSMRAKLGDLIRIAAANDTHLPMRHILVLIVNVLLGVSGRRTTLMTCKTAHAMVAEDKAAQSNPYDNVLGLNLKNGENRDYIAFAVFGNAGLGLETNNAIDTLLIDKEPPDLHASYVASDPVHGADLFESARANYRRGVLEDFTIFQKALEAQRRRLFFVLPKSDGEKELDPWRLTVFRHGGQYIEFCKAGCRGGRSEHIKSRLVIGLNRSYSGTMCEDSDVLWLTGPAANTQSRVGRILDIQIPVGSDDGFIRFDFVLDARRRIPRLSVGVRKSFGSDFEEIASHPLSPLLFEYLMRVERGSLPGSFSRQCFEELRQFRLRVMARLQKEGMARRDDLKGMKVVRLGDDGRLKADPLDIVFTE
jgi:hypothetical protein